MINSLKEIDEMNREIPMFEDQPDPLVDHVGEGRLKIIGSNDWDVRRVPVRALRMVNHGIDPASRIYIQEIVNEISSTNKPILALVSNKFILRLQRPHIGGHN